MTKESGFTLIELIMVIVILGILAAVAIPKFSNLSGAAKIATLKGIRSSMQASALSIYSLAQIHSTPPEGPDALRAVSTEFGFVDTWHGYPEPTAEYIDAIGILELINFKEENGLKKEVENLYARVGYQLSTGVSGCYIEYNFEAYSVAGAIPIYNLETRGCK